MIQPRIKISIASVMMLVVTAASGFALIAQLDRFNREFAFLFHGGVRNPVLGEILMVSAIVVNAIVLARWRQHSSVQTMLQIVLTCVSILVLLRFSTLAERDFFFWWLLGTGVILLVPSLLVRKIQLRITERSRRSWWIKTTDAAACAFINLLVLAGELFGFGF